MECRKQKKEPLSQAESARVGKAYDSVSKCTLQPTGITVYHIIAPEPTMDLEIMFTRHIWL